jgi:peptidoglycan/xylan/chitin deacetylase (PgdA/CDA1 family)
MRYLRKRYRIISLGQTLEELDNAENSSPAVAVTFDDGYRDVYSNAFPVLRKYGIPATVFLTVNSIETGEVPWYDRVFLAFQLLGTNSIVLENRDAIPYSLTTTAGRFRAALDYVRKLRCLPDRERRKCCAALERLAFLPANYLQDRMLTWEHINVMQESGISFGSHTFSHPVVSRLDPGQVEYEIGGSKRFLEGKLGRPVLDFAFPFGQPDDCGTAAYAVLRSCGYRLALRTTWGVNRTGTDRFALHRVQIGEEFSLSRFAFELNQLFLRPGVVSSPKNGDFSNMETAEPVPALSAGKEK